MVFTLPVPTAACRKPIQRYIDGNIG